MALNPELLLPVTQKKIAPIVPKAMTIAINSSNPKGFFSLDGGCEEDILDHLHTDVEIKSHIFESGSDRQFWLRRNDRRGHSRCRFLRRDFIVGTGHLEYPDLLAISNSAPSAAPRRTTWLTRAPAATKTRTTPLRGS